MLLPMGKDLSNINDIKHTFESVTKLTVVAFDFTKVEKITDEYCCYKLFIKNIFGY